MGRLSQLNQLSLNVNRLHGTIPTQIGDLEQMQYLDLYNNSLTGVIPAALAKLTHLGESFFFWLWLWLRPEFHECFL
jgi:Leucine-rich repeat (LRR) protein